MKDMKGMLMTEPAQKSDVARRGFDAFAPRACL